jgi:hypothetical protein
MLFSRGPARQDDQRTGLIDSKRQTILMTNSFIIVFNDKHFKKISNEKNTFQSKF